MAEERTQRRLAAILAADVVGYSRLMQLDEAGTLAALKTRRREVLQPAIARHRGRIVKVMGDGVLIEFASAVDAVECAVVLQEAMEAANAGLPEDRWIVLRIGINLGDVMVEGSDLYGDGVNIAARLEALADAGSVFISQTVFSHVKSKTHLDFVDLGERSLKNMAEPVRVYRLSGPATLLTGTVTAKGDLPSKPSIAVLPFTNMSGDPEQEYFSDGITEDIITDLSQVSALFVVARNTAFTFKGKAVEIVETARKMNVGHILEGSVRKVGNRIRITVQLIDGSTGDHRWGERYDRDFVDIFALQDDISKKVVGALKVRLLPEEIKAITNRPTTNVQAYECYLQGRSSFLEGWGDKDLLRSAREMFAKATKIDPGYARAYAGMADCDTNLWIIGDLDVSYDDILANSTKALALAPNLAEAHASKGMALFWTGHPEEATITLERAIELDSGLFEAHFFYAEACRSAGRYDHAAALFERAAELRPTDYMALNLLTDCYTWLGLHEQRVSAAKRGVARAEAALAENPDNSRALSWGASTMVWLGEYSRAEEWTRRAVTLSPHDFVVRYLATCAYGGIGKPDAALECLEFIFSHVPRARRVLLGWIKNDSQLISLCDRPEFCAFIKRLEDDVASHS
jgi:adenylate cyclase